MKDYIAAHGGLSTLILPIITAAFNVSLLFLYWTVYLSG